jgi:preprotein translocase subunit Sec61beta
MAPPKKGKKSEGFHSAAGLIRYFDSEEESALKIDPRIIVGLCIATVIIVEAVRAATGAFNWWG